MIRLYVRFQQFGGLRLVSAYARMGVLTLALKMLVAVILRKKTLLEADDVLRTAIAPKLHQEFQPVLMQLKAEIESATWSHTRNSRVWFCWLQGLEHAPLVVKVCYESLKYRLREKEIMLLTERNISDYVKLPDFVVEKYRRGVIPPAHYTDLLRLELLIRYGGTWIDATVLCTSGQYKKELFDSDLFVFQRLRKGTTKFLGLSNWFMTACTNNEVLLMVRGLLLEYWRRYDCVVDYFMFHLFFGMAAKVFPKDIERMNKFGNRLPMLLQQRLADEFDEEWYKELCKRTCFHKLTYRLKGNAERKGTFYDVVVVKPSTQTKFDGKI